MLLACGVQLNCRICPHVQRDKSSIHPPRDQYPDLMQWLQEDESKV